MPSFLQNWQTVSIVPDPQVDALKAAEASRKKEAMREAERERQRELLKKQKADRVKHALQVKV